MVVSISILTKEIYHNALSRVMAQVPLAFHGTCVKYLRPFDRYMNGVYTY